MRNKRIKFLFFGVFFYGTMYGQTIIDTLFLSREGLSVKQFDSNGYYKVIAIDTLSDFQFLVKEFYANHTLKMQGTYRSLNPDKKNGIFTWYYPGGNQKKTCRYIDNKLDGEYKAWHPDNKLKQLCYYKNGLPDGVSKTWSEAGNLLKYVEYKDGVKQGKFQTYYPSGKPIRTEIYKNDQLIKGKCFTENGNDTAYFKYFTPPSFLGGDISTFTNWVLEKLQYPIEARNAKEEAEVKVKFTVKNNGEIGGIIITKHDKPYFNSEVLRVISGSPKWTPAIRDIDSIDVFIEIPVIFQLPLLEK